MGGTDEIDARLGYVEAGEGAGSAGAGVVLGGIILVRDRGWLKPGMVLEAQKGVIRRRENNGNPPTNRTSNITVTKPPIRQSP